MSKTVATICSLYLFLLVIPHLNDGMPLTLKSLRATQFMVKVMHKESFFQQLSGHVKHAITSIQSVFTSCSACELVIDMLQVLADHNKTSEDILSMMDWICTHFHIEKERICNGLEYLFEDEIMAILHLHLSSQEICGIIVEPDCAPSDDPMQNWRIDLLPTPKPPIKPIPQPKPSAPQKRVLHLTDFHFDPLYQPGTDANCGAPLCCRAGQPTGEGGGAGKWGDYRNCDVPYWTLVKVLRHIADNEKFDYVLWTGDIPPHDVWRQTKDSQLDIIHNVTSLMLEHFPDIPIYPALGNHESVPVNSFPPEYVQGKDSIAWLYDKLAETWTKEWLPEDTSKSIRHGAFYSLKIGANLKLISLNMNYCNRLNWWLMINMTDPNSELDWLMKELQLSEDKGEKVHIIGHIPPGYADCLKAWSANYYKIINRYESTVRAQFFGHTHRDHFEVFYDVEDNSRATSIAYIAPSVTTYPNMNLAYRIYNIDGDYEDSTHVVLDHETHVLNLTDKNLTDKFKWLDEYTAKDAYQMKSLLPTDWDELITRMETDDELFQKFFSYSYKLHPPDCDDTCKKNELCLLRSGKSYDQAHLCSKAKGNEHH